MLALTPGERESDTQDRFFNEIVNQASNELNRKVFAWEALAVFHKAQVWVDGMKEPHTIKEAMQLPEWPMWRDAIRAEILGLIAKGCWATVPKSSVPATMKILPGQMLLHIKTSDGKFEKAKARYVARGDLSKKGVHYFESASHQVRGKTLRMLFANVAANYGRTKKESYICRFAQTTMDVG